MVRDWQRRHPSIALSLRQELPIELGPSITLTIYRVVQEGLINALRHAQASRVDIAVHCDARRITATVTDDGIGLAAEWARPGHFGLRGLADRVRQLGGTFDIGSQDGRGVRLSRRHSLERPDMIRVLLVDDHAVVRMGFRLLLQSVAEMSVVGEADSGEAACRLYLELKPDVVVMDLAMPGMGGLDALRRIRARHAQAQVLTLSAHDDPMHARRALQEGALGFLSKRSAPEALLEAVAVVAAGRRYLDPALAQKLALAEFDGAAKSPVERLSEREFEVFVRLAGGATVQRIATDLNLSASTIGTHLYNIKQKLGVVNQSELTLIAIRHGLIDA